jgi:hypothetical protein
MTAHRRPAIPFSEAPRGTCRWCGEGIRIEDGEKKGEPNLRRRWHSECVDIYNASDPREARRRIRRRDRGICAECKVNTNTLKREFREMGRGRTREMRKRGFKSRKSLWELDHRIPLIDGGGHGDDNLQTLCTPCHTRKTASEARERAIRKGEAMSANEVTSEIDSNPTEQPCAKEEIAETRTAKGGKRSASHLDQLFKQADATNRRVEQLLREMMPPGA